MLNVPHAVATQPDRATHAARVAQIAGELITEHGPNAVRAAIARLNDAIDRGDRISRDFCAEIVCAIIEQNRGVRCEAPQVLPELPEGPGYVES
jgi:hypothetical protein